jgi:hypothetical protein
VQFQVQSSNATFTARGAGLYGVTYQWQTNGVNVSGANSATLTVTNVQPAQTAANYRVVVGNEVGSIVSSDAALQIVTPPIITSFSLPTNPVVAYQSNLNLNVAATAPGILNGFPLSYQWQFNGSNLAGGSTNYTIHANSSSFGNYTVLISNAAGSTNISWRVIVLNTNGLLVTLHPANQYQISGGSVTFAASGVGINPVTYQWTFNTTNILGATNAALTLTNLQLAQQGAYNAIVTDGVSSLASSNATFALVTPPVVISQNPLTNLAAIFQTNLTLNAMASAPGHANGFPLSYQWQVDGVNIFGATTNSYTFLYNSDIIRNYSVLVTNKAGSTSAVWQITPTFAGTYIAPGTLAYHLSTNTAAHTNGITAIYPATFEFDHWTHGLYSGTNLALMTNAVWSTNFWLRGVQGLSAISLSGSNGLGAQGGITMISPRHAIYAKHMHEAPGHFMFAFLDANNIIHWRTNMENIFVTNDISIGILDSDLPPSVGFLPMLAPNFLNYLPTNSYSYVQGIGRDQGARLFSQPMHFDYPGVVLWNAGISCPFGLDKIWTSVIEGGSSSNPDMFLIEKQLVLLSHNFFSGSGPAHPNYLNEINRSMHYLSTNNAVSTDYQLTVFPLTNWPSIH